MRGYVDAYASYSNSALPIDSFQQNLDYGYENHMYADMLPSSLLGGWSLDRSKNNVEAMFTFAFATEYAVLSRYISEN